MNADFIEIPLTKGYATKVSPEDGDLAAFKWIATLTNNVSHPRASRGAGRTYQKLARVVMSRVLDRPLLRHELVDHINGDTLDDRRENLRLATNSQNQHNAKRRIDNSSGYKGVAFHKLSGKWSASICYQGKQKHLGLFATPEAAYEARCKKALELHGDYARLD